ncbi:MAG: hypothetical protein WBV51_21315 [Pseudolabrys sp.]
MAAAASNTILRAHFNDNFRSQLATASFPDLGIAIVMRQFGDHVANTRGYVRVSLDEPVRRRNMAIAAARPNAFAAGPMRRLLKMGSADMKAIEWQDVQNAVVDM